MPGERHELLEAIFKGNAKRSERLMREHVMSAAQRIVEFVRRYDEAREANNAET
jgi:DNA-binding GntR family transcriptional regulator